MKKVRILFSMLLLGVAVAHAEEATQVILENPRVSTGIEIGDVLERKLVIESKAPYELPKSALPLKGERVNGVELVNVLLQSEKTGESHRYFLTLGYQVFAAANKPVVMKLPEATLSLTGGDTPVDVNIPAWSFWYSPLVAGDIHTARSNAQPQRKPGLLSIHTERLWLALAVLVIGIGGLVYINADRRWLPWMGGSFAQAYRKLRQLPMQSESHAQALGYLHQAFNKTHGRALFRQQLDEFFVQHPQFQSLDAEINGFFQRSEALLFAREHADHALLIKELQQLCRRLRDCERKIA